ncbi:hypothetical protein OIV83_000661 [Microbotryomycetes sp. JL201]|nr:hypothetical protein OIV83_000661 [Microbotryomycetes sp. JL201]
MFAPMARAVSASASALEVSGGLVFKGIFLHPDHLAGFESTVHHDENDSEGTHDSSAPYTGSSSSSVDSAAGLDYFSFRDASSCSSASSSPSSTASTPTMHSMPFKSHPQPFEVNTAPLTSPAMLSFATFAPAGSQPASRAQSPKRGAPACRRVGSSSMQRAVSSPVETQWALDRRRQAMSVATEMINEQASRMARSKSVASPMLGFAGCPAPTLGRGSATRKSRSGTSSPLITPFEEGWGSALPPRAPEPQRAVPFPYNVALKPNSPARLARSHSVSHMEHGITSVRSASIPSPHRNSLPGLYKTVHSLASPSSPASSSFSPSCAPTPASPVMTRPRRGTLTPLTPIISSSISHCISDDAEIRSAQFPPTGILAAEPNAVSGAVTVSDIGMSTPGSPPFKPLLARGVTY